MRASRAFFAILFAAGFAGMVWAGSTAIVESAAPAAALKMGPAFHVKAVLAGGKQTFASTARPLAPAATQTLLDSYTGATTYTTTGSAPRTYMGDVFTLADPGGTPVSITALTVYVAYTGSTAQVYNSLRVYVNLWDTYTSASTPIFSNLAGAYQADIAGPITFNPNTFSPISISLPTPATFTGLTDRGVSVNYQGDTGSGLASNDALTSLLRYGSAWAIGSSSIGNTYYGYRNVTGRTDMNFNSTDARGFGQTNQGIALILQGDVLTPVTLQRLQAE